MDTRFLCFSILLDRTVFASHASKMLFVQNQYWDQKQINLYSVNDIKEHKTLSPTGSSTAMVFKVLVGC